MSFTFREAFEPLVETDASFIRQADLPYLAVGTNTNDRIESASGDDYFTLGADVCLIVRDIVNNTR